MDDFKISEYHDKQIVLIETPKRKERIKIYVPWDGFGQWRICYENGHKIPGLGGKFLSRKDAITAIKSWLQKTRMSEKAKHDTWFGPDEKKEIKRKRVRGSAGSTDNS